MSAWKGAIQRLPVHGRYIGVIDGVVGVVLV